MNVRIQNVYQVTRDMGRALGFYRDLLGMKVKFQDGGKWAQLDAQGTRFALGSPEEAGAAAESRTVVVFEVDDLGPARAALEAAGAPILATRDMGSHGSTITTRDPDGNIVQFFSRSAAPPS